MEVTLTGLECLRRPNLQHARRAIRVHLEMQGCRREDLLLPNYLKMRLPADAPFKQRRPSRLAAFAISVADPTT